MAWTSVIQLDPDKTDVGRVSCIWNEGQPDQFVYTERIAIKATEGHALADRAKTAKDMRDIRQQREAQLKPIMEDILNG